MADPEEFIKSDCQLCGGSIEFPTHGVGQWIECPHCSQKIRLRPPLPKFLEAANKFTLSKMWSKNWWLGTGYLFAVIWPIAGALIGVYFLLAKKERGHGLAMIFLAIIVLLVELLGGAVDRLSAH
jgi:DNA-directed RNA polymerase subunit RPC12/RpoP